MRESSENSRAWWVRWLEWGLTAALLIGVGVYIFWKPINPMGDPGAAQALALVQTHPARSAPSIRQALDVVVQTNRRPARAPSIGEWTVQANNRTTDRQGYLVRVEVRVPADQAGRWVEWEYLWLVRLSPQTVVPLSRPAAELMP
jgi:hypothetical protein